MINLYQRYEKKKKENKEKIYIFKVGAFYIFIDEDAKKISRDLDLKLTKLTNTTVKCGFPISRFSTYIKFIEMLKYDYEIIVDSTEFIIKDLKNIKETNEKEAYKKILEYKKLLMEDE